MISPASTTHFAVVDDFAVSRWFRLLSPNMFQLSMISSAITEYFATSRRVCRLYHQIFRGSRQSCQLNYHRILCSYLTNSSVNHQIFSRGSRQSCQLSPNISQPVDDFLGYFCAAADDWQVWAMKKGGKLQLVNYAKLNEAIPPLAPSLLLLLLQLLGLW